MAKFGFDAQWGYLRGENVRHNLYMTYQFRNGAPIQITVFNEPWDRRENFRKLGFFAQDQWTVKRLTANAGLRLDLHNGGVPDTQYTGPNQYAPYQTWPAVENAPNWKDLSPRLGVAYDLFGNGKTAIKGTLNRYVVNDGVVFPGSVNPLGFNSSATRAWTDRNGDFFPQESELGTLSNSAFGTAITTTSTDDAIRTGWHVRAYNWETSASIQHQLIPQVSVNFGYTRRWFGNFTVTDNLALVPADHDEFCLTAPTDPRLGGVSGSLICGLYDLNPAKRTVTPDNLRTDAERLRNPEGALARHRRDRERPAPVSGHDIRRPEQRDRGQQHGGLLCGRLARRHAILRCQTAVADRGQVPRHGWPAVGHPGRGDVPGQPRPGNPSELHGHERADWVDGAVRDPARTTFSGGSATVSLVEPGTMFGDYMYQLDFRLVKAFRYRGMRARLSLDLANILNANAVLVQNNAYGTSWLRPVFTLQGRLIKPGVQIEF